MLCAVHMDHLPPAPAWSSAIEQDFQASRGPEGSPEAVSIVWTNRNTFSGADDNFFDDVFGTSAGAAQGVVDAALAAWSRVITSFNRGDGTNTLQISITMNRDAMGNFVGGFGGAGGPASTAPADGLPRTGSIVLNAGNLSPEPNDSNGYFLDTTPNDYSEFAGTILTPFAGERTSVVGSDLFSLVSAEVTHCLGLISPKAGGQGANFNGYRLIDSGFTRNTGTPGIRDNAEGGGQFGHFYRFIGPTVSHALTSYNSGDQNSTSWGNAIHTAGGAANFSYEGVTYRGTEDDGNAAYNTERLLPSWVTAHILSDAYGYSIENPAKFGTMYSILNSVTGVLTVRGADNSSDTIAVSRSGTTLSVSVDIQNDIPGTHALPGAGNAPAWVTEYHISQISQINIFPGSGDDTVRIDADLANLSVLVNGGLGADKLQIIGGAGYDSFASNFGSSISTTNATIAYGSMETLEIFTGDGNADVDLPFVEATSVRVTGGAAAQTINFSRLDTAAPTIIDLGGGSDVLNFATGTGVDPVKSPVTIYGGTGDDVINIAPSDFASTVITQPVTIFGDTGNDTLNLGSNNADSIAATITFDGGTHIGGTGDRIVFNDQAPSYNLKYDVQPTLVGRIGFNTYNVTYSNTERVVINAGSGSDTVRVRNGVSTTVEAYGNTGNDNFIIGDGNMGTPGVHQFSGGPGVDQITFDDHLSPTARIWDIKPNEVIFGGLISLATTGFESVGVLAGNGDDEITFDGLLTQSFNVDAGGGNDTIKFGFLVKAELAGGVTVLGGAGNDTFQWNRSSNNWSNFGYLSSLGTNPIVLDGGAGFNQLSMDDATRSASRYDLSEGRLRVTESDFLVFGSDFSYDHMGAIGITAGAGHDVVAVAAVSSDIDPTNQVTINMNGGNDTAFVYPRNAAGELTINGNIGIIGGAGTDSMTIEDAASALPINYIFSNPFGAGTQNVYGLGTRGLGTAGVENLVVNGGSGDDTFTVNEYKSGTAVTLRGGAGDDVLNLGNGNLPMNITSVANFVFDGQDGFDRFNVNNTADISNWTYTRNASNILATRNTLAYSFLMNEQNNEELTINAGPGGDTFLVPSMVPGNHTILNGFGGFDTLQPGLISGGLSSLSLIRGRIDFDAGTPATSLHGGQVIVSATAHADAKVVHQDATSIGAYPPDNYFGAGGSVHFNNVTNLSITGGTGDDTIYVQPLAGATVNVNGNQPASAPGDSLNLALAAAENYLINGTPSAGSVTSDNLRTLSFGGFESDPNVDDVAAVVVENNVAVNPGAGRGIPTMAFDVTFSEDVSAFLTEDFLELFNTTTNQPIPAADIAVAWDVDTFTATFTFPSFAGGLLPDGAYQARILGGLTDPFGNASPDGAYYTFVWSGGTSGDDVFRVALDPLTLDHQVFLNDDATPAFLAGPGTAQIVLFGGEGDDLLTYDLTGGNPFTPGGVTWDGGAGADRFAVIGSAAVDSVTFDSDIVTVNADAIAHLNNESFAYETGGEFDLLAVNAGPLYLSGTQHLESLAIGDAVTVTMLDGGDPSVLMMRELIMATTARLDLASNAFIVDYTGPTPVEAIRALLHSGYASGAWDGFGIVSSTAAANPGTAIGYGEATSLFSTFPATFFSADVDDTSIVGRYTLGGDATLDGVVNLQDFNRLAANFGQADGTFTEGDFNYDGIVNLADFNILASRFGAILAPDGVVTQSSEGQLPSSPWAGRFGGSEIKPQFTEPDRWAEQTLADVV